MRLLVLTHTFPPSRVANAKRPGYVVRAFLDAGWQVDVVTSDIGMEPGAPEVFEHSRLRIHRLGDPVDQFVRKFARCPRLQRAVQLAANGLMWPDACTIWSLRAFRRARQLSVFDRVLAFVIPASLMLSAMRPGMVGHRWVFDLQESVTPQFRLHPKRSLLHRALLPLLAKLERRAYHKAGRVIFTADTNRRACIVQGLVPENRAAHVPYFFDADVFAGVEAVPHLFQIVYLGVFDWSGARSPETFLRSLARFLEKHPEARPVTRFSFFGQWLAEHNEWIDELRVRDVVELNPPVSYEQYVRQLMRSPVLLLVAAAAHNLFMPSKIVDYFGARRPILAFVPRDSEMRGVLEKAGLAEFACDETDVAAGVASLERLWAQHQGPSPGCPAAATEFWSSKTQLPRYLELVAGARD